MRGLRLLASQPSRARSIGTASAAAAQSLVGGSSSSSASQQAAAFTPPLLFPSAMTAASMRTSARPSTTTATIRAGRSIPHLHRSPHCPVCDAQTSTTAVCSTAASTRPPTALNGSSGHGASRGRGDGDGDNNRSSGCGSSHSGSMNNLGDNRKRDGRSDILSSKQENGLNVVTRTSTGAATTTALARASYEGQEHVYTFSDVGTLPPWACRSEAALSSTDLRLDALRRMASLSAMATTTGAPSNSSCSSSNKKVLPAIFSEDDLREAEAVRQCPTRRGLWRRFADQHRGLAQSSDFSTADIEALATYLDAHLPQQQSSASGAAQAAACTTAHPFTSTEPAARPRGADSAARASEEGAAAAAEKQRVFGEALAAVTSVLHGLGLQSFLCCGTALGAAREGAFIAHDDDIDLGVWYEDLVALGRRQEDPSSSAGEDGSGTAVTTDTASDEGAAVVPVEALSEASAQSGVMALLAALAGLPSMMVIDLCGEVAKGLEVRLLHLDTRVRVDINVYYPPLAADLVSNGNETPQSPSSSSAAPAAGAAERWVWCATHYEQSAARKFGMYRYRHHDFRHALVRMPFAGAQYLQPPQRYLEEYFGPSWRTPDRYGYADAFAGGKYKNIIPE